MTERTELTVREVMERLRMVDDRDEFDRLWAMLGQVLRAALRNPPPARPLVEVGESWPVR